MSELLIHIVWWQGETNAPDYIKKCIESARSVYGADRVRVWDGTTLTLRYEDLAGLIARGITLAQIVDMARLYLLREFGGTYFDCDIYHTKYNPIVDDASDTYHLLYQKRPGTKNCVCNGLFHCTPHHQYTCELIEYCHLVLPGMKPGQSSRSKSWVDIGPGAVTSVLGQGRTGVVIHPKNDYLRVSWGPVIRMCEEYPHVVEFQIRPEDYGVHVWGTVLRERGARAIRIGDEIMEV